VAANVGPTILSSAPVTAVAGVEYVYAAVVSDPDDENNGTDLVWSLGNAPAGMVVSETGVVTWTPGFGVTTSGEVTLTVKDGEEDGAAPASQTFTISVTPRRWNPAPGYLLLLR
jgi:hypothetical protein